MFTYLDAQHWKVVCLNTWVGHNSIDKYYISIDKYYLSIEKYYLSMDKYYLSIYKYYLSNERSYSSTKVLQQLWQVLHYSKEESTGPQASRPNLHKSTLYGANSQLLNW